MQWKHAGATVGTMNSESGSTPTNDDENAAPTGSDTAYDASTDPDADPSMLNPRTGSSASEDASAATGEDPDSDPDQLNPRQD